MAKDEETNKKPPHGLTLRPCNCKHTFQDKEHGKGLRVKNQIADKNGYYRCTVCGATGR